MEHKLVAIAVAVAVTASAISAFAIWQILPASNPNPAGGQHGSPIQITFAPQRIGGQPGMNTSDFWVARITRASGDESLSSYRATLLANGSVVVGPVVVRPGQLGESTHPIFEFFEEGVYCSPVPCPPPEGPDGNLSVGDYFRISYVDPATSYTIRVLWVETGEIAGEIVIET